MTVPNSAVARCAPGKLAAAVAYRTLVYSIASPMTGRRESNSAAETGSLGAELAATLKRGDVVLVEGDLGAGKTTFIRGACRALGVSSIVTSPTFTIGQRYEAPVPVSHLDLFRVADLRAEDPDLLDEYVGGDAIAFVEWPQGAEDALAGSGGSWRASGSNAREATDGSWRSNEDPRLRHGDARYGRGAVGLRARGSALRGP